MLVTVSCVWMEVVKLRLVKIISASEIILINPNIMLFHIMRNSSIQ